MYAMLALVAVTLVGKAAPVSEAELKNLLAAIRQSRTTQADFQECLSSIPAASAGV
jgi:hypothetical protein